MAHQKNTARIQELPSFIPTRNFVKREEGLRLVAYVCPAGVTTVGWGHAVEPRDGLKPGDAITEDEALRLLESDVVKAYQVLFRLVSVPLTDSQQTALVSFVFNLGAGRFQASTLRQKLNRGEPDAAAQEFGRWVYAGHPVKGMMKLRGLVSRRQREKMLFLGEIARGAPPGACSVPGHQKPGPSAPGRPASLSLWQKAAAVCVGAFRAG